MWTNINWQSVWRVIAIFGSYVYVTTKHHMEVINVYVYFILNVCSSCDMKAKTAYFDQSPKQKSRPQNHFMGKGENFFGGVIDY